MTLPILHGLILPKALLDPDPATRAPRAAGASKVSLAPVSGAATPVEAAAAHDHVDIERVELDAATDAEGLFGGYASRTRADDDVAAVREVDEGKASRQVGFRCP